MVVLTEEMVIARTKQSNLATITKLNCWGSQLSDISILRRMPNVTVLSLSVNSISSLADFQFCKKLQDLFVRKNNIKDLNEVCHLQNLQNLKSLWLDENPCSLNDDGYRLAVLRALPQLTKLDDTLVDSVELEKAQRYGRVLVHPDLQPEYYSDPDEDEYEFEQKYPQYKETIVKNSPSPEIQYVEPEVENYAPEPAAPVYQKQREYIQNITNYETDQEPNPEVKLEISPEVDLVRVAPVKEEPEPQIQTGTRQYNSIPRSRTADGELNCYNDWRRQRVCQSNCGRRPPERRTNILNAVLCLIKELDYSNLEVVEMAVRCRMDELEG